MLLNSKQFILTSASRGSIWSLLFNDTSWPSQQKSVGFTILKTKNQFILLCCKKKKKKKKYGICAPTFVSTLTMANFLTGWPWFNAKIHKHLYYCHTIADKKTKAAISLNRVYWYDTMCHIFSCSYLDCLLYTARRCTPASCVNLP